MSSSSDDQPDVSWTYALETYFKETAEKSQCLSVLHKHAEGLFNHRKVFLELPTIVLSAVVGFCSVGSTYMFPNQTLSSISLGIGSLFISTVQTVSSYFAWAKRAEGHRISAIQYAKQFRFISIELSLPRAERINATALLKIVRNDFDRLAEVSPPLPNESIAFFEKRYNKYSVSKPHEVNGLDSVSIYVEASLERPKVVIDTPAISPK
jgi:hypothetical protein